MSIFSKYLVIAFLLNSFLSFSQIQLKEKRQTSSTNTSSTEIKTVPKDQLKAIKENYNWKKDAYLIVNLKNKQTKWKNKYFKTELT